MEEVTAIHVWRKVIVEVAIELVIVEITRSVLAVQKYFYGWQKFKVVFVAGSHD